MHTHLEYFLKSMENSASRANAIRAEANRICCESVSEVVGTYNISRRVAGGEAGRPVITLA